MYDLCENNNIHLTIFTGGKMNVSFADVMEMNGNNLSINQFMKNVQFVL